MSRAQTFRTCGCGSQFQLPTLMSRQTSCVACDRKRATALMEARKGEALPSGVGGLLKRTCDAVAMGTAQPVKSPAQKTADAINAKVGASVTARAVGEELHFTAKTPGERAKVGDVVRWKLPSWQLHVLGRVVAVSSHGKLEISEGPDSPNGMWWAERSCVTAIEPRPVDLQNDPLPAVPKTADEALALLNAGWQLDLFYCGHRHSWSHRVRNGRHECRNAGNAGKWYAYPGGEFNGGALQNGDFRPVRPEPA